jgi:hypothetical protein
MAIAARCSMARRIVLALSHSIEEHDQLKLLSSIGHDVFSIGGYINPGAPHDDKRPPLPDVGYHPTLQAAVDGLGTPDNLGAAQERIPDAILDWADTIIYHHYLDRLYGQWDRIRAWLRGDSGRRVIWRSVGQSVEGNERSAQPFRAEGLERVAYSPKEQNIPAYSGHDALIRFYADPDEWKGWTGDDPVVIQVTQHLRQRDPYTNWGFWDQATDGLNRLPLGPGSEAIGGPGSLSYDDMQDALRRARVYCYTGTQPASYTLGLIEAMMTGTPVLSIGPKHMNVFPYGPDLFEGHEIASGWSDDPGTVRLVMQRLLGDHDEAAKVSAHERARAIELFGIDTIREQWRTYLG